MSENEMKADGESSGKFAAIATKEALKEFLLNIRDKMEDRSASPIYALAALNHVMNLADIGALLDKENKELARDVWLRLKQSGFQLKNPPLLFDAEELQGEVKEGGQP
jgi:hypothetical protein